MTDTHTIVDRDAWLAAHRDHLAKEKAFTYERERMAAMRRDLPWMEVSSDYTFQTPSGPVSFADLFDGHSQLILYHFMFGTDWGDEGCPSCSFWADTYNGTTAHFAARDTAFAVVSSATVSRSMTSPSPRMTSVERGSADAARPSSRAEITSIVCSTRSGSNCRPAQARSSANASSGVRPLRYTRSETMAS